MRSIQRSLRFAFAGAMVVTLVAMTAGVAFAAGPKDAAYNSVPGHLPGNVPSQPFQAQQTSEFGDSVTLADGSGNAKSVDVIMSSWGCESGTWNLGDCVTTKGAKFSHPITLNLYAVNGTTGQPAGLLVTKTQTFAIPFRPSADARCTDADAGKWYSKADKLCYNGFIHKITFKLDGTVTLPNAVIWTVAFNTSGYGSAPLGYGTTCAATVQGCPYDSLNVGVWSFAGQPSKGTDVDPAGTVISSITPTVYCDGGAGGVGTLRLDTGCWTGYRPLATIRTSHGHDGSDSDNEDDNDSGNDNGDNHNESRD